MATNFGRTNLRNLSQGVCDVVQKAPIQVIAVAPQEVSTCCPPPTECFAVDARRLINEECEEVIFNYTNDTEVAQRVIMGTTLGRQGGYLMFDLAPSAVDNPSVSDSINGKMGVHEQQPLNNIQFTEGFSAQADLQPIILSGVKVSSNFRGAGVQTFALDRDGEVCANSLRSVCPTCPDDNSNGFDFTAEFIGNIPVGGRTGIVITIPAGKFDSDGNFVASETEVTVQVGAEACNSYVPCEC